MKTILSLVGVLVLAVGIFFSFNSYIYHEKQGTMSPALQNNAVEIIPIQHASALLRYDDALIYVDPTGEPERYASYDAPTVILLTDIHGDHLSTSTVEALIGDGAIVAPQAVADLLPESLMNKVTVLGNDEAATVNGIYITAVPMYNLPTAENADRHPKGRGNGYLIDHSNVRVYVAGDTAGTLEMRALQNVDVALIPMNLPFTMDVGEAADAVLAFAPAVVYPYHYRTPSGFSDTTEFKRLVEAGGKDIAVVLLDWYATP